MVPTIKLHRSENAKQSFSIGFESEEALFRSCDFKDDAALNVGLKSLQDTPNCAWSIAEINTDSCVRYLGVLYSVQGGESVGRTREFVTREELDANIKNWTSSAVFARVINARIRATGECERS